MARAEDLRGRRVGGRGEVRVDEGAGSEVVIVGTLMRYPDGAGGTVETTRRATYVFRAEADGRWLCTVDNSYGTSLLDNP